MNFGNMFCIFLLFVGGINAQATGGGIYPPAYVEARNAYEHAKIFLQESVPYKANDLTDPEDRKHFQVGTMVGVTGALVKAFYSVTHEYKPLRVVPSSVPKSWEDYRAVARNLNRFVVEATAKIAPITTIINTLCDTMNSVEACNLEVHEHVMRHRFLKERAKFLLQLGKAARILNRQTKLINEVADANQAVPYLYLVADSTAFEVFIAELTRAYEFLRPRMMSDKRRLHKPNA